MRSLFFLFLSAIPAFASDWKEYPVQIDLQTYEACAAAAQSMDVDKPRLNAEVSVKCDGSLLKGAISASPQITSVALKINWPKGLDIKCDRLVRGFQKTQIGGCDSVQEKIGSTARFTYALVNGKGVDQIQREKLAALENDEKLGEEVEDKRVCDEASVLTGVRGWINAYLQLELGRSPCAWKVNPAVSNVNVPNKEGQTTGGATQNSAQSLKSNSQ
jgi:hypothetical protein